MIVFQYDKTFEGFLTLVFEVFQRKQKPDHIVGTDNTEQMLFVQSQVIVSDLTKSARVWNGMKRKLSESACNAVYRIQVSEIEGGEMALLTFLYKVFTTGHSIENNMSDPDVLMVHKLYKRINKEAQRVLQFVRFQKTADHIYFAGFSPEYNVISFGLNHFKDRFADQHWILYDLKRNYGYFFNGQSIEEITLEFNKIDKSNGKLDESVLESSETEFQNLWKQYFKAICIQERRNPKLQAQHMPKRYWKYLTEKQED